MATVHLVRDVLDNQLTDVADENAGRVDGLVLELREGEPPRVAFVEVSPITLARRINRRLGEWVARLDRRFGPERGRPFRIPFSRITGFGVDLKIDLRAERTPIFAAERWLCAHVVARIPLSGAKGGRQDDLGREKSGESRWREPDGGQ